MGDFKAESKPRPRTYVGMLPVDKVPPAGVHRFQRALSIAVGRFMAVERTPTGEVYILDTVNKACLAQAFTALCVFLALWEFVDEQKAVQADFGPPPG